MHAARLWACSCPAGVWPTTVRIIMNINKYVLFDSLDSLCESINEKTNFPDDSLAVSPNAGISYPTNNFLGEK